MRIAGIEPLSLTDYPGKPAMVLFTQGCNFRCSYCHNPELVLPQLYGDIISEEKVYEHLKARRNKVKNVVVTGGEPTLHEDLPDFLRKIRSLEYSVKLDTNGSKPAMLCIILENNLVDYVAMDIKAPKQLHKSVSASDVPFDAIMESVRLILQSGIPHEFRTTLHSEINSIDDLEAINSILPKGTRHRLLPFIKQTALLGELYGTK